jgi:hypothetical protein
MRLVDDKMAQCLRDERKPSLPWRPPRQPLAPQAPRGAAGQGQKNFAMPIETPTLACGWAGFLCIV